jgi:hypothetical protein
MVAVRPSYIQDARFLKVKALPLVIGVRGFHASAAIFLGQGSLEPIERDSEECQDAVTVSSAKLTSSISS